MNPALFLLLVTLGLSAACLIICRLADDTYTEAEPNPRCHSCHICGRVANTTVRRRDTRLLEWACIGCRDQGTAWGWWADDLTDRNAS